VSHEILGMGVGGRVKHKYRVGVCGSLSIRVWLRKTKRFIREERGADTHTARSGEIKLWFLSLRQKGSERKVVGRLNVSMRSNLYT